MVRLTVISKNVCKVTPIFSADTFHNNAIFDTFHNKFDATYCFIIIFVSQMIIRHIIVLPNFRPAERGFKTKISRQCEPDSSLG